MRRLLPVTLIVTCWCCLIANAIARDLTFEDRVKAQEAIERVDYSHQIGATLPFERAVPREVLERKVRTYLKQSVALEAFWGTPITPEALRHELRRIERSTRAPGRLEEIFQALGHDAFLVEECFVRPVLADHLARDFFSTDVRIHGAARARAEGWRTSLLRSPRRTPERGIDARIVEVVRTDEKGRAERVDDLDGVDRLRVGRSEFERIRSNAPKRAGEVGRLIEGPEGFDIQILLEASDDSLRIAAYSIPKISWDAWWNGVEGGFDEAAVIAAADAVGSAGLETPLASGTTGGGCPEDDSWTSEGLADPPIQSANQVAVWTGDEMLIWGGSAGGNSAARYDPLTDRWGRLSMLNAPVAAGSAPAVWTGAEMIVWGGPGDAQGGRYDPRTDTWKSISTTGAPASAGGHALIWTGTTVIVWGAYQSTAGGLYDPASDTWSPTSMVGAPASRTSFTAVWSGDEMIVWGGYDGTGYLSSGGRYNPITDTWTAISLNGAPSPRALHTAVWTGSRMIVWGGYDGNSAAPLSDGARYDPQTDSWTPVSGSAAPSGRYDHTATWTASGMLVWGGQGTGRLDTGARYDPGADTWTPMTGTNAPVARSGHTAVWTGGLLLVFGGIGDGGGALESGGRFDPLNDQWTPTATSERPSPRNGHTAVWTGTRMIVWGGGVGFQTLLNSGASFDPLTATWTPTATLNAPSPRREHVAVWTGSVMVAWGGVAGDEHRGTGGRYDPVADSWTPTNVAGAPRWNFYRRGAQAVWTGTQMIVWGGVDTGEIYFGDGGRYDPLADQWEPISMAGAPSARAFHASVWTGSTMLVWGGFTRPLGGPDTYLGDGYAYHPATDSWTPLNGLGAPSGRENHTAVWTGGRMLVWGGDDLHGSVGDGAAYDPQGDAWRAIGGTGAPPPLWRHTAVWADSVMILWGSPDFVSSTGGRYDPTADRWQPVSATNAPPGGGSHSAVWTGREMIVWGGDVYGSVLDTGGSYRIDLSPDADHDGFTVCGGDCDDADPLKHPGAAERCNGQDDNCDGRVDEAFPVGVGCIESVDACHQLVGALACTPDGTGTQCAGEVRLNDSTPPQISVAVSPSVLWPPNHRMEDVVFAVAASDACSTPVVSLLSVTSSEPADVAGHDDGDTAVDIAGADTGSADFDLALRAERDGRGAGRIYTVTYTASDASGNVSAASAFVLVPHDEGGVTEPLMLSMENGAAGTLLSWNAVPGAAAYRVVRGRVAGLSDAGDFIDLGTISCIQHGSDATSTLGREDGENPAAGEAFFYVAAYNDGRDSGFGTVTAPKPRVATGGVCD